MTGNTETLNPHWFSPPGRTIERRLKTSNRPIADFAFEMGMDNDQARQLIEGRYKIDDKVASELERVLRIPTRFWINREAEFRGDLGRIVDGLTLQEQKVWIKESKYKDIVKMGWLPPKSEIAEQTEDCLRYFDVPHPKHWKRKIAQLSREAQLREAKSFKSDPAALAAWIRKGEIEAKSIVTNNWNKQKFAALLPEIRKLTNIRRAEVFLPKLIDLCAAAGVAVVIAKSPKGSCASGATKFLNPKKALLLLSFRYLSDDQFWFSFFHECGHLILHDGKSVFIENENCIDEDLEAEANQFASDTLIPAHFRQEFERLKANRNQIIRFAIKVGISPGIVLGQLQHRGTVQHNYLNYLKRRFRWN